MKFFSTRGNSYAENSATAIVKGLAEDGGLFVPEKFPDFSDKLKDMLSMDYAERAATVLHSYLEEYNFNDLLDACKKTYSSKFEDGDPTPIVKLDDKLFVMELFHGPTLAFKDVALTIMPYLLRKGADIIGLKEKILILTATSGDTGKAALEGFKDQKGISILVYYPSQGVSDMQKLQMQTQEGSNVNVIGVVGNFDDCQTAVKTIFSSKEISKELLEKNTVLSSANSMNFGRLVPQVCYYFSAYCDLVNSGDVKFGDKVDFAVPTGNFGNILAGYYAKRMGLPIGKLVCASNMNNVLTEFFTNGTYDANREFFKTMSPSMDILISSNLERLIFELCGRDAKLTSERMAELKKLGKYSLSNQELVSAKKEFYGIYAEEEECEHNIKDVFEEYGYLMDTHTSIAVKGALDYQKESNGKNPIVALSTASPYKFTQSVLKAIEGKSFSDPFKCAEKLMQISAMPIPEQILSLQQKERRFTKVVDKNAVIKEAIDFAGN